MIPHLTAALVTVLLAPGPTLTVGQHTFHRRTLRNGLEALAVDDGQAGEISVFTVYAVGTRAETEATTGLAHLTEHALFTGTKATPAGQHDAAIKALGGESNAYTRADYTTYYAHQVPRSKLADVLALACDSAGVQPMSVFVSVADPSLRANFATGYADLGQVPRWLDDVGVTRLHDDIQRLEGLLGRDLSAWLD